MGAGKTTAIRTISNIDVLSTEAINTDLEAHQKSQQSVSIMVNWSWKMGSKSAYMAHQASNALILSGT